MPNKIKPENKIKQLEAKIVEAKTILTAINFMNLNEDYPEKLRDAIAKFLNGEEYALKLKREKENDLP